MSRRRSTTAVAAHAAIAVAISGPEYVPQGAGYGWLFPDDKAAPAAVASEPGKADDGAARKGQRCAHSSRSKKQR